MRTKRAFIEVIKSIFWEVRARLIKQRWVEKLEKYFNIHCKQTFSVLNEVPHNKPLNGVLHNVLRLFSTCTLIWKIILVQIVSLQKQERLQSQLRRNAVLMFLFLLNGWNIRQVFLILTLNLFLPAGPRLLLLRTAFLNFTIYTWFVSSMILNTLWPLNNWMWSKRKTLRWTTLVTG